MQYSLIIYDTGHLGAVTQYSSSSVNHVTKTNLFRVKNTQSKNQLKNDEAGACNKLRHYMNCLTTMSRDERPLTTRFESHSEMTD